MTQEVEYFSYVRHELRNQLGIVREGVSQIVDGLGKGDCKRCNMILKPTLECADKLNKLIEVLVSVSEFEKKTVSSAEALKRNAMIVLDHEIRTPLAIAKEGLSLVVDEIPGTLNSKQKELLKNVKDALDRLCGAAEKILSTPVDQLDVFSPAAVTENNPGDAMEEKKKILVVDDDASFLELLKRRLAEGPYQVVTASNGTDALAKLMEEKPQVVLLDIMMPGIDGLSVLRSIRSADKKLPIYIMTAFTNEERFKSAQQAGASGFINKTDDLKKALDNIINVVNVSDRYKGKA